MLKERYYNVSSSLKQGKSGGISAIALYDYQAMAEDEISFDPNDIITNIEMVFIFIKYPFVEPKMFVRIARNIGLGTLK